MFAGRQQEDGPVLDTVCCRCCNLLLQLLAYLIIGKLLAGVVQPGDREITPEPERQLIIIFAPMAEAQTLCTEEVSRLLVHDRPV